MSTSEPTRTVKAQWFLALTIFLGLGLVVQASGDNSGDTVPRSGSGDDMEAEVYCANLIYAEDKTSVCFSDDFLRVAREETNIQAHPVFEAVRLESVELFDYPFAVMSGEGAFELTDEQLTNLKDYLAGGGFLLASSGCSSEHWNTSFSSAIRSLFPDAEAVKLEADHPVFHTVYEVRRSRYKSGGPRLPHLEAIQIDGRVVMIWSPDGLNDTDNAGGDCCCCGGNEARSARKLNVNILAYALTH